MTEFDGERLLDRAADEAARARCCRATAAVMFCLDRERAEDAGRRAVLGHEGDAEGDGVARGR